MAEDAPGSGSLDAFLAGAERRAFRIAEWATRDRDDALDLVQDAMLRFTRHYAHRPPTEWAPLFYSCLQNRVRDWHRRERVRRRLLFWRGAEGGGEAGPEAAVADPQARNDADVLQREEALRRVEDALRDLPARQREVFELRVWEGLDVAQTALAMGCSTGSVKTHLSRALAALRRRLEGVWP